MEHKRNRRTFVRQVEIIRRTRKCAVDHIFVTQLVRLVDTTQNLAVNIFQLRLVHHKDGASLALLELKLSLEGGRGQVEERADRLEQSE